MRPYAAIVIAAIAAFTAIPGHSATDWQDIENRAKGQTVYWNAWAGDERINAYIEWVGEEAHSRFGVTVRHVKVADIAETVSRILAEKSAGREQDGTTDLLWINGENFARMKEQALLYGPFTPMLPNFALVDIRGKPTTLVDFTVPTDGMESPWGMAQIVFIHDATTLPDPPRSISALLDYAKHNPGRLTYPQPPAFTGTTFLKQGLIGVTPDPSILAKPVTEGNFAAATAPLWAWLDEIHPHLWRSGNLFPRNEPAMTQLLADSEIDISFSFNPGSASSLIRQGILPDTVRTYVLDGGTIANTHFVAIPFNAKAKEGAMVVANFLLSPEAQARKLDPTYWGDMTVLNLDALTPAQREVFAKLPRGEATLPPDALGTPLPEPHPSWMTRIEEEWRRRYER